MSCTFTSLYPGVYRLIFVMSLLFHHASLANNIKRITQEDIIINLDKGNYKLGSIFRKIEQQTGLIFNYGSDYVNIKDDVSINGYTKAKLEDVLKDLLTPRKLKWILIGKDISLSPITLQNTPRISAPPLDTAISVSGRITNEKGEPIEGATVRTKNGAIGTSTKSDGSFSLTGIQSNALLIISSISFLTQEVGVNRRSTIGTIALKNYVGELDETIVLAYSTTTRRYSTGNVGTVKAKDIGKQPVTNPLLALQGRVPGVVIEQSNGLPNSSVSVRIQGQNSLKKGSDPLYVIDGVPISAGVPNSLASILGTIQNNTQSIAGSGPGAGNPLSFVNPSDIESIDILKDADATAIYGSRAAAGAILITTKKGKIGQTKVETNVQRGGGRVTRKLNMMNTKQYLEMRKEAFTNDGRPIPDNSTTPSNSNYDLTVWDQNRYTDWQKVLLGGTAQYTTANANISGGTTNTNFIFGGGYNKQTTVFPGDQSNNKASAHFSISNTSTNKKFKAQLSGNYMIDKNHLTNSDLTGVALQLAPNAPNLYNLDRTLNWESQPNGSSTWTNPLAYINQTIEIKTNNLISNVVLSYQIASSLTLKGNFGYTTFQADETMRTPLTIYLPEERSVNNRATNKRLNNMSSFLIEPQVNFKHQLVKGRLDVLLGSTIQSNSASILDVNAQGFTTELLMNDLASASSRSIFSGSSTYRYNALFGIINYNLKDKYIFNFTGRRDGSSRFGSQNLFHNFGSIAGAWIISNENIVKKTIPILSFGKIKASYGTTGNDQIGDYQFLNLYSTVYGTDIPYQNAIGLAPNNLPNPYLQWEETKKLSFGIDLGFVDDRILLSSYYYRNRSSNQLLSYDLPIVTGFPNIAENFSALLQNSGYEFSLNTINFKNRHLIWSSSVNLTINRNKLISFPELSTSSYSTEYVIGKPFTISKVYQFIGVNKETGLYSVADKTGKPTSSPIPSFQPNTDATILIDKTPKYYGGLENTFSIYNFNFSMLLQFVKQTANADMFGLGTRPGRFSGTSNIGNQPIWILDRWQKPGDWANVQMYSTGTKVSQAYNNANNSSAAYIDASYIRLKNVSLSWEIPSNWKKEANINSARLFILGQNLLTITKYKRLDPETKSSLSLPPLRIITFGLNVTL